MNSITSARFAFFATKSFKFILLLLLTAMCDKDESETYAIEPHITFENVSFADVEGNGTADTLSVTFGFTDGDGDLGREYDNTYPHQLGYYYDRSMAKGSPLIN
jgi:hypothetical protein